MTVALLSPDTVGAYLARRGLVPYGLPVRAAELGGGVSNVVLAVDAPGLRAVVKQSLHRLRVADEWLAKRERAVTEGEALRLAGALVPGSVPQVLDIDGEACVLTIARAPDGWTDWKRRLLRGEADPAVARWLGEALAAWHAGTRDRPHLRERFDDGEAFDQLRVDPYHRTVMRRHPQLGDRVGAWVERMLLTKVCLVHGDYSPKNVLVGAGSRWVVDWEVAHWGDPAFDLAFMLNHLMLKAIHRPPARDGYRSCALAFWDAYRARGICHDLQYVLGQLGCLMVARVDGKSPAEYLTPAEREVARRAGVALLTDPPPTLEEAWALIA